MRFMRLLIWSAVSEGGCDPKSFCLANCCFTNFRKACRLFDLSFRSACFSDAVELRCGMLGCTHVGGIAVLGRVDSRRRTKYGFEVPIGREGSLKAPLPGGNIPPSSRPQTTNSFRGTNMAPTLAGRGWGGRVGGEGAYWAVSSL